MAGGGMYHLIVVVLLLLVVADAVEGARERRGIERDLGQGKDGRERRARSLEQMATDVMRAATENTVPEPYSAMSRHLADPVGVLFGRFREAFDGLPRGSGWWIGEEREEWNEGSHGISLSSIVHSSLQFSIADEDNQRHREEENWRDEDESVGKRGENESNGDTKKFGHGFTVRHTPTKSEGDAMNGRKLRSWPPWAKRVLDEEPPPHIPLNSAEEDCSGRGVMQGDIKNICDRQDCAVTELRCPPDFEIVDLSNYTAANLTACRVDEVRCMDSTLDFTDYEVTRILELLCEDGRVVGPDEGDLDHCSIVTLISGALVLNFTLTDDYDDKCFVDFKDCPDYCDDISVSCDGSLLECPQPLMCVDDFIQCEGQIVTCHGAGVPCDDTSMVRCEEHFPDCSDFSIICEEEELCPSGEVTCGEDGLARCEGELALCDSVVVACADTERTVCHELPRHSIAYAPLIECGDSPQNCTELFVACDMVPLLCDEGWTWVFNETLIEIPYCLRDDLLDVDLFQYYEDRDSDEEVATTAEEMCRGGVLSFHCTMATCMDVVVSCDYSTILSCPSDSQLRIDNPDDVHSLAYCDDRQMVCYSDPECPIAKLPCEEDQSCSSLVYECNPIKTANCTYQRYPCVDACWVMDGDWDCACPIDFTGGKCGHHRDYSCDVTLISPEPHCVPFDDPSLRKLDSDPVCLEFSVNDMVTFMYSIECRFDDREGLNETEEFAFDYYARRGNEFAKSMVEVPYQASLRLFDFARLSDLTKSQVLDLTPGQLVNGDAFYFDLDVNHIYASSTYKPRYFFGGRMYIEAALFDEDENGFKPRGLVSKNPDCQFLDFYDFVAEDEDPHVPSLVLYLLQVAFAPTVFIMVFLMISGTIYFVKQRQYVEDSHRRSVTD